jgi:predicted DNA-binding protein (MmcQ/YjbR family)
MNGDDARKYFLSRPEAIEDFPFRFDIHVFKIGKKMFGTLSYREYTAYINLKCDPEEAMVLRDVFAAVRPGYHMNKAHWNTVTLDGSIPSGEIERMIDRSYGLVVRKLKKTERIALEIKHGLEEVYR